MVVRSRERRDGGNEKTENLMRVNPLRDRSQTARTGFDLLGIPNQFFFVCERAPVEPSFKQSNIFEEQPSSAVPGIVSQDPSVEWNIDNRRRREYGYQRAYVVTVQPVEMVVSLGGGVVCKIISRSGRGKLWWGGWRPLRVPNSRFGTLPLTSGRSRCRSRAPGCDLARVRRYASFSRLPPSGRRPKRPLPSTASPSSRSMRNRHESVNRLGVRGREEVGRS